MIVTTLGLPVNTMTAPLRKELLRGAKTIWSESSLPPDTVFSTETLPRPGQGISAYTTRGDRDLVAFVLGHLDSEEREWFFEDILKAVHEAWVTGSLEPLGRVLRDWEETAQIKRDPHLSRELHEAFEEADTIRASE